MSEHETEKPTNDLEGLNKADALEAHGPQSYLINRLARFSVLGWLLFFITLVVYMITVTVFILKPDQLLTVEDGKLVGEYHSKVTRSESDALAASIRFVEYFLSHNSKTVMMDKYNALGMMDKSLRAKWKNIWFELNAISEIEKQKIHCVVLVDTDNLTYKHLVNNQHYFSTKGDIVCGEDEIPMQSFKVDFTMVPTSITKNRTAGMKVINLFSEPFNTEEEKAYGEKNT